jgi:ATP-dependent Clp protease ATP-binding subunit ClpA
MDFYNFFSFSAKKAIYRAAEICSQFNNQFLEPEHIFYSILNLRSCSAVQVLHQLGVNLPKLSYSLEAYLYEHAGSFKGQAVFSQRTIALLDSSYKEVRRLHHREIATSHLLIALSRERGAILRELFAELGLDHSKLREAFLTHLKGFAAEDEPEDAFPMEAAAGPAPEGEWKLLDSQGVTLVNGAWRLAQQFGHAHLQPRHMLLALAMNSKPEAGGLLFALDIDIGAMIVDSVALVNAITEKGETAHGPAYLELLTRAFRHALNHQQTTGGNPLIGAYELLLALAEDPEPELQALLQRYQLEPERIIARLLLVDDDQPDISEPDGDPEAQDDAQDAGSNQP